MATASEQILIKRLQQAGSWLVALFVLLLPFQTRWIALPGVLNDAPWEYGTVSLYAIDILLLFIIAIGLTLRQSQSKKRLSDSSILVFLLLLIAFISFGEAVNRVNALFWFAQLAKGILLFFALSWIRPKAFHIARAFLLSGLMQSVLVHLQFFVQRVWENKWLGMSAQDPSTLGVTVIETAGERWLRAYGSLPHPNIAGMFLALALVIGLGLFARAQTTIERIILGGGILVTSSALWLTFSRQAWIAAAIMCAIILLYTFWTEKKFPALASIALLIALIPSIGWTVVHPELTSTRFTATERIEQKSIDERAESMQQSLPIIQKQWLTGVGIGNYTAYLHVEDQKNDIEKPSYAYQPVHNIYILVLTELGIAGLIVFVLFIISLFIPQRQENASKEKRSLENASLLWKISFLGLLTVGLFDHYLWSLPVGITLFWLFAGLTAMPIQKSSASFDE